MICIFSRLYTITIVYNQESDKLINILMITGLIVNSVKQMTKTTVRNRYSSHLHSGPKSRPAIRYYNQKAAVHPSKVFIAPCRGHYDDK